jgi:hypothetical protein
MWGIEEMIDGIARVRLADLLAVFAAGIILIAALGACLAKDFQEAKSPEGRPDFKSKSIAIVSNGLVTAKIVSGPTGLEVSSNAPGMITITSGSNSVSLRGDIVNLSGAVSLAPYATPGVNVTPDGHGGYMLILDPPTEFDLGR